MREPERSNRARGPRILIAGGGTGGHAIPALCVAADLSDRGAVVEFVGSQSGIEKTLVPKEGYTLHALPLTGLAGSPIAQARAGLLSLRATIRCARIIQQWRPRAVLGVGGYASAPAVMAARTLGVPTFLHEQNSVPGRVNRLASRFTTETLATFPGAAQRLENAVWVGMPTRTEVFDASRDESLRDLGLEPPVVLIFGGSGGALRIN
ncbi:MAG: glycosyltransferase, partial [Rubrobacteraceae bacterium]|nr:glycosyltransferase [Rubrobacteraceae bacterium]